MTQVFCVGSTVMEQAKGIQLYRGGPRGSRTCWTLVNRKSGEAILLSLARAWLHWEYQAQFWAFWRKNVQQTCWKTLWSVELYKDILRKLILSNLRKRRLKPDQTVALKYINYGHKEKKPECPQRCTIKAHGQQTQITPREIWIMYHEISTNNENTKQEGFRMLKNLP